MHWLDWHADAFARAAAERKPVLLAITASWCYWCHEMDRTSYATPDIVALINERLVPVRVDSDRRPDINERYNLGGWPTTAFLTPGGEVLGGSTFLPPDRLRVLVGQVADAFASGGRELEARAEEARAAHLGARAAPLNVAVATIDDLDWFKQRLRAEFDPVEGGFGVEPKLPHAPALQLAIELFGAGRDAEWLATFTRSLDAMGWGGLYDQVDGGFFRYAATRDWSLPHTEKLLDDNAALLRVYLAGWQATDHRSYRDKAIDIIRYVHATLADRERGGFAGSQAADPDYYALASAEARRRHTAPEIDATVYTDANGAMAGAYLRAACLFDDSSLGDFAVETIERIVLAAYRPGDGLAHVVEPVRQVTGLLSDHVWMAEALLEAHEASGRLPFIEMAEELMRHCLRTMWDARGGGFYDRATGAAEEPIGLLRDSVKPLALNCQASRVLARIAAAADRADLADAARAALHSQAGSFRHLGLHAAPYALAVRAVLG